jgi:alpha-tubulin suppressor-like RCC1 family protein
VVEKTSEKPGEVVSERPRQVTVGEAHSCAITKLGAARCWGENGFGQLGDGTTEDRIAPTPVLGLESGVRSITAGESARGYYTCALLDSGGVKCWGENSMGQLGDGTTEHRFSPVQVVGLESGVARLVVESDFACALMVAGGVKCWGDIYVGDGSTDKRTSPTGVEGLSAGVRDVQLGADGFACALLDSGGVKCWGENTYGQLGNGKKSKTGSATAVDVIGLQRDVTKIAVGESHACALVTSGDVKCWGWNYYNQISGEEPELVTSSVSIGELGEDVVEIVAGGSVNCALKSSGKVKCWGNNERGLLGDGTKEERVGPVEVVGLSAKALDIALAPSRNYEHVCVILESGGVECWGRNDSGQLGDGTTVSSTSPRQVLMLERGATKLALGSRHGCALMKDDRIKCWGDGAHGQLGSNVASGVSLPSKVIGLENDKVEVLASGVSYSCVLTEKGGVKCWGDNRFGQLGDGTKERRPVPVDVLGLTSGVIQLEVGLEHNCALLESGEVKCWGWNVFGQVGDGTKENRTKPLTVAGLKRGEVSKLVLDAQLSCALLKSGGVKCWGDNEYGQLGRGKLGGSTKAAYVEGLKSGVEDLAVGGFHICAKMTDGDLRCWGGNSRGAIGNGVEDRGNVAEPVKVVGLASKAVSVGAGSYYSCALLEPGEVKCWGVGDKLGVGDAKKSRATPTKVLGLASDVSKLVVGDDNTCAILESGALKCWGHNGAGQLGDGSKEARASAVSVAGLDAGVAQVTIGYAHQCAVMQDRSARCWGANGQGECGNGDTENALVPITPEGMDKGVEQIVVGESHTCALRTSGEVWCWGEQRFGQLGNGTIDNGSRAVFVAE